jgi:hypothetical protein
LPPDVAIRMELRVRNVSDHAVVVHMFHPTTHDVEVLDSRGVVVSPAPQPTTPLPPQCAAADCAPPIPMPHALLVMVLAPGAVGRLPFFWTASKLGWVGGCCLALAPVGPLPAGRYTLRASAPGGDGAARGTTTVEIAPSAPVPPGAVPSPGVAPLPIPPLLDAGPPL